MPDPVGTTAWNRQSRRGVGAVSMAALGVAAGITGYAAAGLCQQRRQHTDTTGAAAPDNHRSVDTAVSGEANQAVLQGFTPSTAGPDPHQTDAPVVHLVDLKRAVVRRPGLAIALTALVVATVTWAITVLATTPGPHNSAGTAPAYPASPAQPADPPPGTQQSGGELIPMIGGHELSGGMCTDHGPCSDHVFAMELGGDGPWVVTTLGFRPLELVPGRRVTRMRWELHNTGGGVVQFPQTAGNGVEHNIALVHLAPTAGDEYRAWRIIAVVEASVPAPYAVRTGLRPFEAYGHPAAARSGEEEFPTRAAPAVAVWPDATLHGVHSSPPSLVPARQ